MPRRPAQVSALLSDLGAQLPVLLRGNLVGIYLYGSLTQGSFDPKRSDIDCIVVTKRALSDAQFKRLGAWLTLSIKSNRTSRLQVSFLLRDKVLTMNSPSCLYQFGRLTRSRSVYRAYAVLTLCRILYSFSTGTIVSKRRAARWSMKHLPTQWNELILQALASDAGKRRARISIRRIAQFIDFTDARLHTRPLPRQRV